MKKISTVAAKQIKNFREQKLTIGLDLGDRSSWYCVLDEAGEVVLEQRLSTTPKAMKEVFGGMPRSRIALETGMHSPWVSRVLSELGHEVIVAHARNVRLIGESRRKDDRFDARTLARLARIDPQLLSPVQHRSAQAQSHLMVIRARAGLVRVRTSLINTARGLTKSYGERLRGCSPRHLNAETARQLSPELQAALEPLLGAIESLSQRIYEYNQQIAKIAKESYPQVARLEQVKGVGTLIALTYMLTLEDAQRFRKSRDAGCYVGLQPGRRNSGQSEPQLHIQQGRRSVFKNFAGAGSASHSGTVRSGQRPAALGFEAGGARREKWEETSGGCDGAKAGRVAASLVGERRGLRTAAQQQTSAIADGSISSDSRIGSTAPRAEFR
jgi:transposase